MATNVEPQAGEPARKLGGGWEVIGPDACPLFYRRTLLSVGRFGKVLWHRFVPNATDAVAHDHPRSFVTLVLRGGYEDIQPCRCRDDHPYVATGHRTWDGNCIEQTIDKVRAPTIRLRHAEHTHVTKVHPDGCTTLVIMGPLKREWGFWKDGRWFEWKMFERMFGLTWRCDE